MSPDIAPRVNPPDASPRFTAAGLGTQPPELGRYVLLRELGRGAIGVVYAAYHEGLDRKLAIKVLNRARAGRADLEARLRREARALAKLSHPNVVQVYDVGDLDGRVFVVMEFVEGRTLGEWMREPHSLEEILAMFSDAGRGLAAAHAAGVVHRDFKPDNVIVGVDGRPRVLDFGLARPLERGLGGIDEADRDPLPASASRAAGSSPVKPEPSEPSEPAVETNIDDGTPDTLDSDPEEEFGVTLRTDPNHREGQLDVLTRTGARMGTPAYMSPEQLMAKPVGPSSDQFSFCVALHEALYGRRPYAAKKLEELIVQVHAGAVIEAPAAVTPASPDSSHAEPAAPVVPAWLRAVILRGLSPNPADRFASMDALIEALEPPAPVRSRRVWALGLGLAAVVAVALVAGILAPARAPACPTLEAATAELWTPERARELANAFTRSELAYADAAWSIAEARLSTWAQSWAGQRVAACEAAQLHRGATASEQPDASSSQRSSLDHRRACLDRDRRAFAALLGQLREADPTVIEHAVEAAAALPDPARCGDADLLDVELPPPPAAVAVEVAELRSHLAELDTRGSTGRWESGLVLAQAAVEQAKGTRYAPLIAEAHVTYGRLLAHSGVSSSADAALEQLQEALDEADRSGHHELVPIAATELVSLSIYTKPDPVRGRLWARRALAGLDRLEARVGSTERAPNGGGRALRTGQLGHARARGQLGHARARGKLGHARARGIWALGNLERLDGANEHAEQHLRAALELLDTHAPGHPDRGVMLNDLGNVLVARGDRAAARVIYEQALAASVQSFGEGHPRVANAHYNLARLAYEQGEHERARAQADLAYVIYAAARGAEHRDVGAIELLRAGLELAAGEVERARAHASKAKVIYERELGPSNPDRAEPHEMLGNVAFMADELDQAILHYRASLAIKRRALPPGHIGLTPTVTNLGLVYLNLGDLDQAIVELGQAVELLEAGEAVDPELLRANRGYLGDVLLMRGGPGDHARAAAVFEAALAGCSVDPQTCEDLQKMRDQATAQMR
ncbi:Serine/threonine protein kinase [Enhygromyxa salina]|uniref:Serine/threonine protein kinase n=1 Tax=Enhygromyxa salina TaxID=215803 RepID=A0A0C2D2L3_9BACT|nr:serine/threonine-protein kinase [Enhygromyxa salina]KIG17511.1 Serine/threonine protein kinase [Enhygromyxa salina]